MPRTVFSTVESKSSKLLYNFHYFINEYNYPWNLIKTAM